MKSLSDKQLQKLSETDNEYPLQHTSSGISLDLQWEITGGYFPTPMTFEDLLFYLCVHGNQHTWKQLDHVCCVAGLLSGNTELDFDAVFETALQYKGMRMLCIGLLLAQDLMDANIPEPYAQRLVQDSKAVELSRQIGRDLRSGAELPAETVSHRFMKYHLLSMDTPFLAISYGLRLVLLPTRFDWQRCPLPGYCSFLHYLIRPFRLGFAFFFGA